MSQLPFQHDLKWADIIFIKGNEGMDQLGFHAPVPSPGILRSIAFPCPGRNGIY